MNLVTGPLNWSVAIKTWFLVILVVSAVGYLLGSLVAGRSRGSLVDGFIAAADSGLNLFRDLFSLSLRRIWAITWHSVLESIRRRMLLAVMAVFVVLFMFAGWYLPSHPTEQVKVYVSFVLMSSTLIAMLASGLLACLSLPSDIKEKTIHTVVSKPVRRLEIVIGRVFGLTLVATAILLAMGSMSYIYLRRSAGASLVELAQRVAEAKQKEDPKREAELKDDIEQIENKLTARVPIYAEQMEYTGEPKNVGHESTYRLYIEGNKTDAAVWHFTHLPVDRLLAKIPLEMTFTVFRTTKGEVGQGVVAQMTYKNPKTGFQIADYPFVIREYYVNRQVLSSTPERNLAQLFQGSEGMLDIGVRCLSGTQYLGMAPPDLYILLDSANFGLNFFKGMVGVWLRVFLIICVAVMFSTFLSNFVAMLATAAVFAGGSCMPYLRELASGKAHGGGPLEAAKRLVTHENLERPLDQDFWTQIIKGTDEGLRYVLQGLTYVLPDLGSFNVAPLVANGFDIAGSVLVSSIVAALGYAVPFVILGYFFLQAREIAR